MIDLSFFLCILFVFMLAYGVASQAILKPNSTSFGDIFLGVAYKSYFQIFGELFLEDIVGKRYKSCIFLFLVFHASLPLVRLFKTWQGRGRAIKDRVEGLIQ